MDKLLPSLNKEGNERAKYKIKKEKEMCACVCVCVTISMEEIQGALRKYYINL